MKKIQENDNVVSIRDLPEDVLQFMANADRSRFLKGPNGNICIGYRWNKTRGEKYSNYEGGLVSALVSNWDTAQECGRCGRKIVHEFFVYDPDSKTIMSVGKECLPQELGFEYIAPTTITKIMRKQEEIQRKIEDQMDWIDRHYTNKFPVCGDELGLVKVIGFFHERGHKFNAGDGLRVYYNQDTTDVVIYPGNWLEEVFDSAYRTLGYEMFTAKNFGKDLDTKLKNIFPNYIGGR